MFQLINTILHVFRDCFKREKTWQWFVVLVIGLMTRSEFRGVTSVVSALMLNPKLYHTMLHFFRSTAYEVRELYNIWIKVVVAKAQIIRIAGRVVLLGDHSKVPKEGRRMPGIQILHQESDNSGKPEFIEGHNFGQVSAVITNGQVSRSLPLKTQLQESPPKQEGKKKPDGDSLVVQMVKLVIETAKAIGEPVVVALDAYFSNEPAWTTADKAITETGERLVEIVTRAQTNTVAFKVPEPPKVKKRGQPRKYGEKVVLYDLFSDMSKFVQTSMTLYGKRTKVHYLCMDLIWRPVKKLVRFVVVETDSGRCVLMSTSLTLSPEEIITIYALRFKIETSFDEQKNDMGAFAYHFWTTGLPKRKRWKKTEQPTDPKLLHRIERTRQATDSFVGLCTIATGILSIIAFSHSSEIWKLYPGWIRTLRSSIPTIATTRAALGHNLHTVINLCKHLPVFSIIKKRQRAVEFLYEDIS
jgi:hypothetical protein